MVHFIALEKLEPGSDRYSRGWSLIVPNRKIQTDVLQNSQQDRGWSLQSYTKQGREEYCTSGKKIRMLTCASIAFLPVFLSENNYSKSSRGWGTAKHYSVFFLFLFFWCKSSREWCSFFHLACFCGSTVKYHLLSKWRWWWHWVRIPMAIVCWAHLCKTEHAQETVAFPGYTQQGASHSFPCKYS